MSIGIDTLMALVQTRRQGLKQDSLMIIVSTSGGSIGVNRRNGGEEGPQEAAALPDVTEGVRREGGAGSRAANSVRHDENEHQYDAKRMDTPQRATN
jgi:hypothetical protein